MIYPCGLFHLRKHEPILFFLHAISNRLVRALLPIVIAGSTFCWVSTHNNIAVANESNLEFQVKAAYLYNFTKFVTWPDKPGDTFNICIVGNDPFGSSLEPIKQKTALNRPIKLIAIDSANSIEQCHIAYFNTVGNRLIRLPGILTVGSLDSSLSVSNQPFFAEQGGMIGFAIDNNKIRLYINLNALKKSGLSISAKLMEVAELVESDHD